MLFIVSIPFRDTLSFEDKIGMPFNITSLIGIILITIFFFAILSKRIKIKKVLFVALIFLLTSQLFLTLLAYISGYNLNLNRIFSFVQYYAVVLLVSSLLETFDDIKKLLGYTFISTLILCSITLFNFLTNTQEALAQGVYQFRAFGGFRNPSYLGLFIIANLPLILYLFLKQKGAKKAIYLFSILISLLALILSFMRSAYLVVIILFLIYVFQNLKHSLFRMVLVLISLPIIVFTSYLIMTKFGIEVLLLDRIQHIQNMFEGSDNSVHMRSDVMLGALNIFIDNVFIGVGPGNLPEEIYKQGYTTYVRSAENTYLHIIGEYGLFIVLSIAIFILSLKDKYKYDLSLFSKMLNLSIWGILMISMFDNNQGEIIIYIILGIRYSNYFYRNNSQQISLNKNLI